MTDWPFAVMDLAIVLAFGVGWLILEWQGRRLDRQRDARDQSDREKPDNS